MGAADRSVRQIVHEVHFDSLMQHSDRGLGALLNAVSAPDGIPGRGAYTSTGSAVDAIRSVLGIYTEMRRSFQRLHEVRAGLVRGSGAEIYGLWDVQAPLLAPPQARIAYESAIEAVCDVTEDVLGKGHEALALFEAGYVNVLPESGGVHGAFTTVDEAGGIQRVQSPWYGDASSLLTLAHEVGHAMHSLEGGADYPRRSRLVRETVARLFEVRMLDHPLLRAGSLDLRAEWWRAQFFRPMYQSAFEAEVRNMDPQLICVDSLTNVYREILSDNYGPSVSMAERDGFEWVKAQYLSRPRGVLEYAMACVAALALSSGIEPRLSDGLAIARASTMDELLDSVGISLTGGEMRKITIDSFVRLTAAYSKAAAPLTGVKL